MGGLFTDSEADLRQSAGNRPGVESAAGTKFQINVSVQFHFSPPLMTLKVLDFDRFESWTVWEIIPPRDTFKSLLELAKEKRDQCTISLSRLRKARLIYPLSCRRRTTGF